ncbi:FUSC family protein [Streptomyces malaysiensis]|uniref:FUSC family protein n=1 Tax=Streptomyces malaysiensis TaxID=92644 RepID=UPI00371C6ADF
MGDRDGRTAAPRHPRTPERALRRTGGGGRRVRRAGRSDDGGRLRRRPGRPAPADRRLRRRVRSPLRPPASAAPPRRGGAAAARPAGGGRSAQRGRADPPVGERTRTRPHRAHPRPTRPLGTDRTATGPAARPRTRHRGQCGHAPGRAARRRVFDGEPAPPVGAVVPGHRQRLRRALGPAGREYAARVALCVGVSTALAQRLPGAHWYWLPATAAFLVKPDMGPLVSRALSRALGTAVGVAVFGALATLLAPGGGDPGVWPVVVAAVCSALIPVSVRHFALQTAVLTPLLLALVHLGGDTDPGFTRLTDTLLACGVVLAAGALPGLGGPRAQVSVRLSLAVRATRDHLDRVLTAEAPYATRLRLRREAYRALADARRAVEVASAEHPPFGRDLAAWAPVVFALEEIVDAATACGVRLDQGAPQPEPVLAARLRAALSDLADAVAARRPPTDLVLPAGAAVGDCATLADVTAGLHRVRDLAPG